MGTDEQQQSQNALRDIFRTATALGVQPDPIVARIDIHKQMILLRFFEDRKITVRQISGNDLLQALASDIEFDTGLLPQNTLWWSNKGGETVTALWEPPKARILALQTDATKPPRRFKVPLPGLVFLCTPRMPPWVFAAKKMPKKPNDQLFHAPLTNLYHAGNSCAGNQRYSTSVTKIPEQFFLSFFTTHAEVNGRSKKHPKNILHMWAELDESKAKEYPLDDLIAFKTVKEVMKFD